MFENGSMIGIMRRITELRHPQTHMALLMEKVEYYAVARGTTMDTTFVPPCAFGSILLMPSITLTSVVPSHFLNLKYCLLNFELIYPHPTTFAIALYETKNLAATLCSVGNNGGWTTAQIPIF